MTGVDKKQRRLELSLLACLTSGRMFVPIMDACGKYGLSDACFRCSDSRAAWSAVLALFKSNESKWRADKWADDVALKMAIEETVEHRELSECKPDNPTQYFAEDLAKTIVALSEKYALKQAIAAAGDTVESCVDVQTALLLVRQALGRFEQDNTLRNSSIDIAAVGDELAEGYHEARRTYESGEPVVAKGLHTPWSVLNGYYNGMKVGLNLVAARASEGKTALAINLSGFWRQRHIKHAFISLDMPCEEAVKRYGCFETELTDKYLSNGKASSADIERHRAAIHSYKESVYLYDNPWLSAVEMSIREAHQNGAQTAIVDYLQLVRVKGCRNKWDAVIEATASLKELSKELKIPLVLLAQLNRQGVRDGREPELHDIEGGGFIEQAASSVITITRDKEVMEIWKNSPPLHLVGSACGLAPWIRPVWLNLMKNQNGAIGKFPFVMYCPFFALRPACHDAVADSGRGVCATLPFFSEVRDDWRRFSFDV